MAADLSKNIFELFSGTKRTRLLPTLAIAMVVTALVVVPLIVRAVDARQNPPEVELVLAPADVGTVTFDTSGSDPAPLDQATVGGMLLIAVTDPDATAVSFNLFVAGSDEPIVATQDLEGPNFDLMVSETGGGQPLDSTLLPDGDYELFVTIRKAKEDQRTAVRFTVANS